LLLQALFTVLLVGSVSFASAAQMQDAAPQRQMTADAQSDAKVLSDTNFLMQGFDQPEMLRTTTGEAHKQVTSVDDEELFHTDLMQDSVHFGRRRRRRRRVLNVGFVSDKIITDKKKNAIYAAQMPDSTGEAEYEMRPNWIMTQRCNSKKCMPCEAGDGCFVYKKKAAITRAPTRRSSTRGRRGEESSLLQDTTDETRRGRTPAPVSAWKQGYGAYYLDVAKMSDVTRSVFKVCLVLDKPPPPPVEALLQSEDSASDKSGRRRRRRAHTAPPRPTSAPTEPPPEAHVAFRVRADNGKFIAKWNGKPVELPKECSEGQGKDCTFHRRMIGDKGLNTFKLVFKPFHRPSEESLLQSDAKTTGVRGRDRGHRHRPHSHVTAAPSYPASFGAEAIVKYFWVTNVPINFASCEDHTSCLAEMVNSAQWTQEAKDLRNSVLLQYQCLNGQIAPTHNQVCDNWKKCLEPPGALRGVGRVDAIKDILKTWRADIAPPLFEGRRLLNAQMKPDPDGCRNPWLSDPESWDCACHDTITDICDRKIRDQERERERCFRDKCSRQKCKKCYAQHPSLSFDTCYRDMLCHPSSPVCESWKSASCPSREEDTLTALLSAEAQATAGWNCG
jgi:hypothetical protein